MAQDNNNVNKVKSFIGDKLGYLIVLIIVIGFFVIGVIVPAKKSDDIWSILCDSAILLALGITITSALIYQALLNGDKNQKVVDAREQVNLAYKGIKDKTQHIDVYVFHKNRTAQREVITNCLKSENLEYSNHFNEDGTFKYDSFLVINDSDNEFVKKDKEAKNKMLKKLASGVKITTISRADVLCQDEVTKDDPLRRAKAEKRFMAEENGRMIIFKVMSAIFGGMYGATFVGISWGEILYKMLWAILLIAFALVSYMKTYRYKTVDYVARLNQSAEWMDEFGNIVSHEDMLNKLRDEYNKLYYSSKDSVENNSEDIINQDNNIPNNNKINTISSPEKYRE